MNGHKINKILILASYPAPYRVGLFEYFKKEFDVTIFLEECQGDKRDKSWFQDGDYYLLDTEKGRQKYQNAINYLKSFDIVLFYEYSTSISAKLIGRCIRSRIPYVINADGVMLAKHGNVFKDVIKRVVISNAAGCLASGERAKEYFLQYGAKEKNIYLHTFSTLHKEDILRSPVSKQEKGLIRKTLGLHSDKKIAIAVGRFIPLKRYDKLILAWINMPKDFELLLIGGGEEEQTYRKLIDENHITNIVIDGFHPKEELMRYYMAADVFVHPTSYDVWGLVVNEAMACGLPAVVSDKCVAGLELVRDGQNGYLVSMGDDAAMCRKVVEICKDGSRYTRMAQNALDTIRPYTIENMADTHVAAVKEILNID
jgi:glycosyltransferase involved in cell wall biosynthesis